MTSARQLDITVEDLWLRFSRYKSRAARDDLVLHYVPLVRYVAGRMAAGLPQSIEQADLVSYGMFGLIDALEKFDPERGIKFETYAFARIRGAIIDELRSVDWVPRSVRAKARAVETAAAHLEGRLLRTPTSGEVADELGISVRDLAVTHNEISLTAIIALDADRPSHGKSLVEDTTSLADRLADPGQPITELELEGIKQVLASAIDGLGEREKVVFGCYYFDGLTLAEIGQVLGVSESRVCQIHTKAVLYLRSRLAV